MKQHVHCYTWCSKSINQLAYSLGCVQLYLKYQYAHQVTRGKYERFVGGRTANTAERKELTLMLDLFFFFGTANMF
jgi:hypothetical protein